MYSPTAQHIYSESSCPFSSKRLEMPSALHDCLFQNAGPEVVQHWGLSGFPWQEGGAGKSSCSVFTLFCHVTKGTAALKTLLWKPRLSALGCAAPRSPPAAHQACALPPSHPALMFPATSADRYFCTKICFLMLSDYHKRSQSICEVWENTDTIQSSLSVVCSPIKNGHFYFSFIITSRLFCLKHIFVSLPGT